MIKLKLIRDHDSGESTIGRLYANEEFICFTLEDPWKENQRRISCIPPGCYKLETKTYGRYHDKYGVPIPILRDVPNRSEILIHPGNYSRDTQGCILVGDGKADNAVWNSVKTWKKLLPIFQTATEIEIEGI